MNTADKDRRISMENMANIQTSLSNNVFQSYIIKFRPSQESLMVNIDRLKIYQVITNLLNNSLKSLTRKYDQLLTNHIKQIESIIFVSISVSNTKVIPYYPEETSDMIDNDLLTVIFDKSSITNGD